MTVNNPFLSAQEAEAGAFFLQNGWRQFELELDLLGKLRDKLYEWSMEALDLSERPEPKTFFDHTCRYLSVKDLNQFRLTLIRKLSADPEVRIWLYRLARKPLHDLVGNELAMQRALNLSIQLPNDPSSLLPLHSDVWSGNSPYEVVFWLPLVDCHDTKSMYVLPRHKSDKVLANFKPYSDLSAEAFYQEILKDLKWMNVPYGQALLFSHSIIHGNRVNEEPTTRWTMNVRFKSLLSPYGSKEVGESFLPITIKPATRVGYEYQEPEL